MDINLALTLEFSTRRELIYTYTASDSTNACGNIISQKYAQNPLLPRLSVLHKIEGDAGSSRYWYARTTHSYDEFADPKKELAVIKREVESGQ